MGQDTKEKLKDHLVAVDMDLNNLFKGVFLFPQHNIINMENRTGLPSSTAYVGYMCVVNGKLNICTASGTPGSWVVVGDQTA